MSLNKDVEKRFFLCCLSPDNHYAYEPIEFVCGGNACYMCVKDITSKTFCRFCGESHDKSDALHENIKLKSAFKTLNLNDVFKTTTFDLNNICEKLNSLTKKTGS